MQQFPWFLFCLGIHSFNYISASAKERQALGLSIVPSWNFQSLFAVGSIHQCTCCKAILLQWTYRLSKMTLKTLPALPDHCICLFLQMLPNEQVFKNVFNALTTYSMFSIVQRYARCKISIMSLTLLLMFLHLRITSWPKNTHMLHESVHYHKEIL